MAFPYKVLILEAMEFNPGMSGILVLEQSVKVEDGHFPSNFDDRKAK
jgi:hypothetical protein